DRATAIETDDVERVLADIDTDHGGHTGRFLSHGRAPFIECLCQPIADSAGARPDHPIIRLQRLWKVTVSGRPSKWSDRPSDDFEGPLRELKSANQRFQFRR